VFKVQRGHGPGFFITSVVAQISLGILASVIVMWFSLQREFRADEGGARLAGRDSMIAALERLHSMQAPNQLRAFGIAGGDGDGWRELFMTHPPLAARIAALRRLG
jgi:heat shock protein HtpX